MSVSQLFNKSDTRHRTHVFFFYTGRARFHFPPDQVFSSFFSDSGSLTAAAISSSVRSPVECRVSLSAVSFHLRVLGLPQCWWSTVVRSFCRVTRSRNSPSARVLFPLRSFSVRSCLFSRVPVGRRF